MEPKEGDNISGTEMALYACLCFLLLLLIVAAVLLILTFVTDTIFQDDDEPDFVGGEPTTPLDPYVPGDCNFAGKTQPHVISQCQCNDMITQLASDTLQKYQRLRDEWILTSVYSTWSFDVQSCEAANQALVWLASGYAEDSVDLLQRYTMAFLYFSTEGPDWTTQDNWLADVNVCEWFGLQCEDGKRINLINLNNNRLLGPVSHTAMDTLS